MVETIGVRHTIDCSIESEAEEKKGSDVPRSAFRWVISVKIANGEGSMTWDRGGWGTYRLGNLGIILPPVRVSTSRIKGIMESTL